MATTVTRTRANVILYTLCVLLQLGMTVKRTAGLRYAAPRNGCEQRRGESAQKRFQSAQTLRIPSLHTSRPSEKKKQHIITSYTDR